jgi:hypothetical protein
MSGSTRTRFAALITATAATAALVVAGPSSADAAGAASARWAPAATAAIHPGVQMFTKGAQCTGNFVFTRDGAVYVGYAAHCAGKGAATDTNGCKTKSYPLGTKVTFNKSANLASAGTVVGTGKLVYSSWIAMHRVHEKRANVCAYNDLALVKVNPGFVRRVNPSVPFWGGPTGLSAKGTGAGAAVYSYGNSLLRGGVEQLSPKRGASLGRSAGGWTQSVYTVSPGIPGDSGSGFMNASGAAVGVLSTVELAPLAGSNGVGSLAKEVAYARSHGMSGLRLARGTTKFTPIV